MRKRLRRAKASIKPSIKTKSNPKEQNEHKVEVSRVKETKQRQAASAERKPVQNKRKRKLQIASSSESEAEDEPPKAVSDRKPEHEESISSEVPADRASTPQSSSETEIPTHKSRLEKLRSRAPTPVLKPEQPRMPSQSDLAALKMAITKKTTRPTPKKMQDESLHPNRRKLTFASRTHEEKPTARLEEVDPLKEQRRLQDKLYSKRDHLTVHAAFRCVQVCVGL